MLLICISNNLIWYPKLKEKLNKKYAKLYGDRKIKINLILNYMEMV